MRTMNKFIITQEYRRFAEFCKACRKERYIGLCYGPAGVGKTMSANHYAGWDSVFKQIGLAYVELLIIDEAERLQARSLEQIREIYDSHYSIYDGLQRMGVIFIGMPGIEKRLIRFPQLYSRIGFAHVFRPLQHEEIESIIQTNCKVTVNASDIMDQEAIAAMTRITNGNFRLINRLLRQSIRVMQVNGLPFISKEVVEAARECLVIGNIY